jgi:hypothetical protein
VVVAALESQSAEGRGPCPEVKNSAVGIAEDSAGIVEDSVVGIEDFAGTVGSAGIVGRESRFA